jgi:hypothetical protein
LHTFKDAPRSTARAPRYQPKTVIEALETFIVDQHVNWKKAIEKVKKALE